MRIGMVEICFVLLLVGGTAWLFLRQHLGHEVLAELDLPADGKAMLTQEPDWGDLDGYWVELWYRKAPGELWGGVPVGQLSKEPWSSGGLWLSGDPNVVWVGNERGESWSFDLRLEAVSYMGDGFIFDPDWQPRLP